MDRKEELIKFLVKEEQDKLVLEPLIDEIIFLEKNMDQLKKLPFIQVHPKDPSKQRATPAAKQYKELLQQYTNIIKILNKTKNNDDGEESPLRKWVKKHVDSD